MGLFGPTDPVFNIDGPLFARHSVISKSRPFAIFRLLVYDRPSDQDHPNRPVPAVWYLCVLCISPTTQKN